MEVFLLLYTHPFWAAGLVGATYLLLLAIYRLWLSPIAHFPGPRLAALTLWYEFYYDTILHGQLTFENARMHRKYGPIVRISPYELHIDDPEYYEVLYSRDSPRNKYEYYVRQFGQPQAAFSAVEHSRHRLLRASMNPFFSLGRIRRFEPKIQDLANKLCKRLKEFENTGNPITIQHAGIAKAGVFFKPFPWLHSIMKCLPKYCVTRVNSGMGLFFGFQQQCVNLIQFIIDGEDEQPGKHTYNAPASPAFFHEVLKSDLPPSEKSADRLAQEMLIVVAAGAETTAKALAWITFHLLDKPEVMQRLLDELQRLDPNQTASLLQLEQMPYLNGVILEGLRLSYGISSRLPRIAPYTALQYKEWSIPPGTPVGMTSVIMHHNESVFPDSYRFMPERWLEPDTRKHLEKYMVAFSKGSRQCIGANLAKSAMLFVISKVFRQVNFELFETTVEDVTMAHELFLPFPKVDSKGVRVVVKS
ncbi:cytochrome P450 [Aspergillus desertorum]